MDVCRIQKVCIPPPPLSRSTTGAVKIRIVRCLQNGSGWNCELLLNGCLINWDFIRWSATSYSTFEIHYIANGRFHGYPCRAVLLPLASNLVPGGECCSISLLSAWPPHIYTRLTNEHADLWISKRFCFFHPNRCCWKKNTITERTRRFLQGKCMKTA